MAGNWQQFIVEMSALSTAAQTVTEHLVKARFANQLDTKRDDPVAENRRVLAIHLISGTIGGLLAGAIGLKPIVDLVGNSDLGAPFQYVAAGVLVSFGSSFFNDALDAVKAFGDAQKSLKAGIQNAGQLNPLGDGQKSAIVGNQNAGQAVAH